MRFFDPRSHRFLTLLALFSVMVLSTCSVNQVGLGAKVDITPPKVVFTKPSSGGQYFRSNFSIEGTTSDDLSSNVSVALTYETTAHTMATQTVATTLATQAGGSAWKFTVPSGTGAATDIKEGSSTLTVVATDESNKTSTVEINIIVDNKNPTILVTVPSSYGLPLYATSNYLEIKGEVYDPSPITEVAVTLVDAAGAPALKNADGTAKWKVANGTNSWNTRILYGAANDIDLTGKDGQVFRYLVRATDAAGNVAQTYYHVQDFSSYLTGGALFPSTDAIGQFDQKGTALIIGSATATVARLDGSAAKPFGNFLYDPSTNKPQVSFTNLSATAASYDQNVLGFNPSIRGTIERGSSTGAPAIDPATISVTIAPLSDLTATTALTPVVTNTGGTYTFRADIKTAAGVYYTSGYYRATIHAETASHLDKTDQTVVFMINTKVPWVITDSSMAPSSTYAGTYLSPIDGFKVRHRNTTNTAELPSFTVGVPVWDQNGADKVTSLTARAYIINATSTKTELTATNSNGGVTVRVTAPSGSSNLWQVVVPFPADASLLVTTSQIEVDLILTNDAKLNGYLNLLYNIRSGDPVVTITPPGTWVTGNFLTFNGTGSVANTVQVRTALVPEGTYANEDAAKAAASTWSVASNVVTWSATHDVTALTDGTYDFWAIGRDSDGTYGTPVTSQVKYDKTAPTFVESSSGILSSSVVVRNTAANFGGTVSDPNLSSVSVSYQRDGATPVVVPITPSSGTWAWSLPAIRDDAATNAINESNDGIYDITFTASDASGKTTSFNRKVQVDTTSPFLTITSPVTNELVTSTAYTIRGQVTDNGGKGIAAGTFQYSKDSTNGTDGTWTNITLSGLNWSVESVNFSTSGEGRKNLWVRASDGLNPTTVERVAFNYDIANPTLEETSIGTAVQTTKTNAFTLSGTAADSNALAGVNIYGTKDGIAQTPSPLFQQTASGTWTYNKLVDRANHTDDGLWVFTIRATDVVGNVTTITRTVMIDTTAPSVTVTSPSAGGWTTSASLSITGVASDGTGTGVGAVYVKVDAPYVAGTGTDHSTEDPSVVANGWVEVQGRTSWNTDPAAPIALSGEGFKTLWVKAKDAADNLTTTATSLLASNKITFGLDLSPPSLTFTNLLPTDLAAATNLASAAFTLSGVTADTNPAAKPTMTVTIDGAGPYPFVTGTDPYNMVDPSTGVWKFTPAELDGAHSYVFTATDVSGKTSSTTRTITIDKTAPTVSIVNPSSGATLNGIVTINASASDANGILSVKYLPRLASDVSALPAYNTWTDMGSAPYAINWDTTALSGAYKIYVGAQDKAGNLELTTFTPVTLDQSTDIPAITLGNMDVNANTLAQAKTNLFNTATVAISATAADDDGLDKASVQILFDATPAGPTDNTGFSPVSTPPATDGSKNTSFSHSYSSAEGAHFFYLRVWDKASLKLGLAAVPKTIGPVYFAYDSANPALALNASDVATYDGKAVKAGFTFGGTTSDNNGVAKLEFSFDGGGNYLPGLTLDAPGSPWTKALSASDLGADGVKNLRVKATDGFGKTSTQDLVVTYDATAPSDPVISTDISSGYFDSQLNVSGTTSDATSGVATVRYAFDSNTGPWTAVTGQNNWFGALSTSGLAEGPHDLWVQAVDRAGNASNPTPKSFIIDRNNPVIDTAQLKIDGAAFSGVTFKKAAFTLTVVVTDTQCLPAAANALVLSVNGTPVTPVAIAAGRVINSANKHTYTYTVSPSGDGLYELAFNAKDNVGRDATTITRTVTVDSTAPSVSIINPTSGATLNGMVTINAAASDANGIQAVKYWTGTTTPPVDFSDSAWVSLGSAPYAVNWNTTALNGAYKVYVGAQDQAGNLDLSTFTPVTLDQATDIPSITLTNMDVNANSLAQAKTNLFNTGTVPIAISAADDDGLDKGLIEIAFDGAAFGAVSSPPATDGSKNTTFSHVYTGAEGAHFFHLRVWDKLALKGGLAAVSKTIGPVYFAYDSSDPVLTVNAADATAYGGKAVKADFTLHGTSSDNNGIAKLELSLDGGATWPTTISGSSSDASTVSWTQIVTVPAAGASEGTKALRLRATDGFGKTSLQNLSVTFDTVKPATPVFTSTPGAYVTNSLSVAGTASDGSGSGVQTMYYRLDGTTGAPATGTLTGTDDWFSTINIGASGANLPEGTHSVATWAIDRAGNLSDEKTQSFTIDRNDPSLSSAEAASQATKANMTLDGTALDSLSLSTVTATYSKDGAAAVSVTNAGSAASWQFPVAVATGSGTYIYTITATDSVGRSSSITRTVIVDTQNPLTSIANINSDGSTLVNSSSFTVTGSASDVGLAGLASVEYSTDGGTTWVATTGTSSWIVPLTGLTDGLAKNFRLRAADAAGNTATELNYNFKVDLAAPTFTETTSGIPNASLVYKNTDIAFGGDASDGNNLASITVTYAKNGAASVTLLNSATPTNGTWSTSLPKVTGDGSYELTFTATDSVGKTTSFTRNILIDTAGPDLSVTSPLQAGGELVSSNSYILRGQITDNGGKGVTSLQYRRHASDPWTSITVAGLNWVTPALDFSSPKSGESLQGARTLFFRASDGLNPDTTKTVTFFYDTEDPVFSESDSGLTVSQVNRKTAVTFGGSVSDSNAMASVKVSLNGATAVNVTGPINASGTSTWSYSLPNTTQGAFNLVFTATDVAGRTSTYTRNVLIDTTKPATPVFTSTPGAYVTNSLSVAGTASDGSGSGVQTMYYRLDGTTGAPATGTLTGTDDWFSTINIGASGANLPEGTHSVATWAIDRAGNLSDEKTQSFTIDRNDPTVDETAVGTTDARFKSTNVLFEGQSNDTNALRTWDHDGNAGTAEVPYIELAVDAGAPVKIAVAGDHSWSYTLDVDTDGPGADTGLVEGTHELVFTATDVAGRTSGVTRTLKIDTTKPTITVPSTPASYIGNTVNLSGTADDAGTVVADVDKVEYQVDGTTGTWLKADGATSWSKTIDFSAHAEGVAVVYFRAVDKGGLISDIGNTVVNLDRAVPRATETNYTTALVQSKANVIFAGQADDSEITTNRLAKKAILSYSKDGGAVTTVTLVDTTLATPVIGNADGSWTWTLPTALGDGLYSVVLTVTDVADKVSTVTRTVQIDTTGPSLVVAAPVADEATATNSYQISGTARDTGGVGFDATADVEYKLSTDVTWTPLTLTGTSWGGTGFNANLGTQEGTKVLNFRTTDKLGNVTTQDVSFSYDLSAPSLSETTIATTDTKFTNADSISLGGALTDTNSVWGGLTPTGAVTITATKDDVPMAAPSVVNTAGATAQASTWSSTVSLTGNGLYVLTITGKDAANKSHVVQRTIRVDKTIPTVTPAAFSGWKSGTITISGTAGDLGSSNLKGVQYQIDTNTGTWLNANGSDSWSASIDTEALALSESSNATGHTIYVRSLDNAGNVSAEATLSFGIDRADPVRTLETPATWVNMGSTESPIWATNTGFTLAGNAIDNTATAARYAKSVSLSYVKDSGLPTPVTLIDNGLDDGTWSYTQPVNTLTQANDGLYLYTLTVTDKADKVSTITKTVLVDTKAPSLLINSVSPTLVVGADTFANGTVTVSVSSSDDNGLSGVKYFLQSTATPPTYSDGGGTAFTSAPYSKSIDTTLKATGTWYLYVLAQDKPGNVATTMTTLKIDQTTDKPKGTIDSPADGLQIGADKKVRGTFSDDDGVAAKKAILRVKKSTDATYTPFEIDLAGAAGQLISWSVDLTSVLTAGGDGAYNMYLHVDDINTTPQSLDTAVQSFSYDNAKPTVVFDAVTPVSPIKAAYKTGDVLTMTWTATDASGITNQTVDLDGGSTGLGTITNPSGNTYQVTYTVPAKTAGVFESGNKTFTLVTEDGTGKTTTKTLTFLVDVDAPAVENALTLNPAFIGFTPNGQFSLKGTASDNRGLSKVEVSLKGPTKDDGATSTWQTATLDAGNWTLAVNSVTYVATSGTLDVKVRSVDQAGNISPELSFAQSVDQSADKPTVVVISPVNASTYGTTVQISGTAADDDNLADLNDDGTIDADAVQMEYWNTSTPGTKIALTPTITGSGKSAAFNYSLADLPGASYQVHVRAKDDFGTLGDWSNEVQFSVNAGAPNMALVKVDSVAATTLSSYRNNKNIVLEGTATDSDGIHSVQIRVNGGGWTTASLDLGVYDTSTTVNWRFNLDLGTDGLKTLEIQAKDTTAFVANQQLSTTVDTKSPTGAFDAQFKDDPTGSLLETTRLNKVVRITGTVTELNLIDTNPIELTIDGVAVDPTKISGTFVWSYVWDTSALADGAHTLALKITDKSGNVTNTSPQTVTTLQSSDVPVVTSSLVAAALPAQAGNNVLGALLKVSGTFTDDDGFDSNTINLYLDADTTAISASNTAGTTGTWEYTWSTLSPGEHYLRVKITDRNGATVTTNPTYFLVDTQNPELELLGPSAGSKVKAGMLTVSGNASDLGGLGTTPLSLTLQHSNVLSPLHNVVYHPTVSADKSWSQGIPIDGAALDGTLYLNLTLTDRAGKTTSVTRTVTLDTTAPALSLTYPATTSYINGLISVTGTADDTNGLDNVTMEILDPVTKLPKTPELTRAGSTLSSWSFSLNSPNYSNSTWAEAVGAGLWKVYFRLAATDQSGNVRTLAANTSAVSSVSTATGELTLSAAVVSSLNVNDKVTIDADTVPAGLFANTTYYVQSKPSSTSIKLSSTAGGAALTPTSAGSAVKLNTGYPWFIIDTDGDKPSISVTQPKNGDQIGGTVNMYGSTSDDDGPVMRVEMRVDFNGDGNFTDTRDLDGDTQTTLGVDTPIPVTGALLKVGSDTHRWEDESAWYVIPTVNDVYNLELNAGGELYSSKTGGNGQIVLQIRSRDKFGVASEISTRTITLDETFPRIENITPNDQTYQKGTFNLVVDFGDNIDLNLSGNSKIKINLQKGGYQILTPGAYTAGTHPYTLTAALGAPQHGYKLTYPIDTTTYFNNSSGILYVDLFVQDESIPSPYQNQKAMTFYVDNQKPDIAWSTRSGAPDGFITPLNNGMVTLNGLDLAYVEGDYGDSGAVSGVDHMELYFVKGGKVQKIRGGSAEQVALGTEASVARQTFNGTDWITASSTLPLAKNSDPGFGDDYVMKVDKAQEMNSSFSTAVDLDGDQTYEFMGIVGSQRFRAAFDSQYLQDGLNDLHYIIYDTIGNTTHKVRQVYIANHKPEITKIELGTDLNGNGTLDGGELSTTHDVTPAETTYVSGMKARNNKLYIQVTATGGNGTKRYSIVHNSVERNGTLTNGLATIDTSGLIDSSVDNDKLFVVKVFDSTTTDDGDATSELFDTLTVKLGVFNNDSVPPAISVAAFGKTYPDSNNEAAKTAVVDVTAYTDNLKMTNTPKPDTKLGHVEYAADSLHNGTDADVSGQVVFKGKVSDDQRIQWITATIPNFDGGNGTGVEFDLYAAGAVVDGSAKGWTFALVNSYLTADHGQVANWNFTVDTAKVTGGAFDNLVPVFKVYDYKTGVKGTTSSATSSITVDVVPYITDVSRQTPFTDRLASNTMNPGMDGYFPVYQGATGVVISGFNLPSSTDTIGTGAAAYSVKVGTTDLTAPVAVAGRTQLTVTIPGTLTTGDLTVKTNNIASTNNANDNAKAYNAEGFAVQDDRKIYVDDQVPTITVAPFGKKFDAVDVDDTTTPKAQIDVTNYNENIALSGQTRLGHVEYAGDSAYNGTDADISGQVIFKGKAADNQRISRITATIPGFNGDAEFDIYQIGDSDGLMSGTGWSSAVDGTDNKISLSRVTKGHVLNWSFTWDSSLVANTAVADLPITFKAYDATGAVATPSVLQVDVVPYIQLVTTPLSDLYTSAPSVFNRSALGKYPVSESSSVQINGFNFGTSTTLKVNGTSITPSIASTSQLTFNTGTTATSGPLVLTVNGQTSSNNQNNDTKDWNKMPNSVNNNLLNDDVSLDIWKFTEAGWSKGGGINNPNLKVGPAGQIGFSFGHSVVYFSMPGRRNGETVYRSQTAFQKNYGWFTSNNFAYDAQGNTYGVALCPDTGGNAGESANFAFFARTAGKAVVDMGLDDNYGSANANSNRLSNTSQTVNGLGTTNIFRVQSPEIVTTMPTPGSAASAGNPVNVYIAYYDDLTKEVRFRYGTVGATGEDMSNGLKDIRVLNEGGTSEARYYSYAPDIPTAYYQTVAATALGTGAQFNTTTAVQPGKYVAMGVQRNAPSNANSDVVMLAWYDKSARKLYFSYNTDPKNLNNAASRAQWQGHVIPVDSGVSTGLYVKMAVDSDGGIHLAYYSAAGGDLKYAYLTSYTDTSPKLATVDSYLSVGTNCTIDVAKVGTNQVPYIGYSMPANFGTTASAKLAYRTNFTSTTTGTFNGSDATSFFTGNWEITCIPETATPIDAQVSVGVYRNQTTGLLTAIPTGTYSKVAETNTYPVSETSTVFGNGTTNPVLGYATDEGILKMAQRK